PHLNTVPVGRYSTLSLRFCFADLEQMSVRVAEEGPNLPAVVDRRGQELGSAFLQELIGAAAVGHPEDQLGADPVRIVGGGEGHGRLVLGPRPSRHQQQPAPQELEDARRPAVLAVQRGAEHSRVPVARPLDVGDHEQAGELHLVGGERLHVTSGGGSEEPATIAGPMAESPEPATRTDHAPRATRLGILAVLGPVTAFSLMNIIVKIIHTPALIFAFYRLWLGAVVMLLVLRVTRRRLTWRTLKRALLAGALFGVNICLFFSALKLTSVADVLIVAALQPALTLLVAGPLFGERVTGYEVVWTAVSLGGVILVIVGSTGTPVWSLRGDLLAVGALVAWTTYWLLSKRVRQDVPALEYMTAVTLTAAVVVTPVALLSGQSFE